MTRKMQVHNGYTLVELLLYLSLFSVICTTLVTVYIATQNARVEQQSVSLVEQRGALLLHMMTQTIRRGESIISPASSASGAILMLQMSPNAEYPTIFTQTSTGDLILVQKVTRLSLLDSGITVSKFSAQNIGGTAVFISFDISTTIPVIPPKTFTRHFESTISLSPDDTKNGGGCGSCPEPSCTNHLEQWYHCENQTCTLSTVSIEC